MSAIALALLAASGVRAGAALESEPPSPGRFLIANEHVHGSFERSVVFLVSYSESGALGLIVNRRTEIALHDVVKGALAEAGSLYLGGPVERRSVWVLLRAAAPPAGALRVAGDVFMTVDPTLLLERTGREGAAADLRVYAGYAGWGAGQLDAEIARGDWIVADESPESVFDAAPDELWKKLHLRHHRLLAAVPGWSGGAATGRTPG